GAAARLRRVRRDGAGPGRTVEGRAPPVAEEHRARPATRGRRGHRPCLPGRSRNATGMRKDCSMAFHVDSEAGRLRRVILHRPDLELKRLTPSNKDELLFDDVLWVRRARAEHDGFADVLRDRGVTVHLFGDLLAETLALPAARALVLDRVFDEKEYGPLATDHLRAAFETLPARELAEALVGGMTKREFLDAHPEPVSVRFHAMELDDFLLRQI